jgi:hypothetical protein
LSTTFNARTYWPQPGTGRKLTNTFDDGMHSDGIVQTYTRTKAGSIVLRQTINRGVWDSDWYYKIDPRQGVLEYRDDYPRKRWIDYFSFWRLNKQVWCVEGREIYWGGDGMQVATSPFRICETYGPFGQLGLQELNFYDILPMYDTPAGMFHDVLVMEYWQQWGSGKIEGAKMWMAPGVGQVRAEWSLNRVPSGYSMMIQKSEWS